jgi:hypothetical protein
MKELKPTTVAVLFISNEAAHETHKDTDNFCHGRTHKDTETF